MRIKIEPANFLPDIFHSAKCFLGTLSVLHLVLTFYHENIDHRRRKYGAYIRSWIPKISYC